MVTSAQLAKATGWLIIVGPIMDIAMVVIKPGNFVSDHPDGPTQVMVEAVQDIARNSGAAHLAVEVGLFASFLFLLGCYGVERVLRDGSWGEYLRKVGLLMILVAYTLRAASYATGHLASNYLTHGLGGDTEATLDSAILLAGLEGTLGLFSTVLLAIGVALFGLSLMNASLIGADRTLAILLAILPAIGVTILLLIGSHVHGSALAFYFVGNLLALVQVVWTTLLGVALIRKSYRVPALTS